MKKQIPLSVPLLRGNEWQYIKQCLDTNWVSSAGKFVEEFERKISRFVGARYAIACVNGTAALYVMTRLAGVAADDEVVVPTVTFIAPVNVVRYLNAHPVFMDCDDYYNIDAEKAIRFVKQETVFKNGVSVNKKTKRVIRALVVVHVFGNAVDLEDIVSLCRERNIKIIEDSTGSLGTFYIKGKYKDRYTGSIGDMGCYSFNGNKIMTTGSGGMIVTDNPKYAQMARYLTTQAKDDEVRYIHNDIGYNFRLTNLQAAVGVAQLEQLQSFIEVKRKNYEIYKKEIDKIKGLSLAAVPSYARNNCWMYALQIDKSAYKKDRERVRKYLHENGIETRPLWYLSHMQRPYKDYQTYCIDKAYKMLDATLNIPCSSNLTQSEIYKVIDLLRQ